MRIDRLLELADKLDDFTRFAPPGVEWNFEDVADIPSTATEENLCGTRACAIGTGALAGWCGLEGKLHRDLDGDIELIFLDQDGQPEHVSQHVERVFEITRAEANDLFLYWRHKPTQPSDVADDIRTLVNQALMDEPS